MNTEEHKEGIQKGIKVAYDVVQKRIDWLNLKLADYPKNNIETEIADIAKHHELVSRWHALTEVQDIFSGIVGNSGYTFEYNVEN